MNKHTLSKITRILAVVAAVSYSSWIVGYFVNHEVALYGTASELAVKGQPYAQLFRIGDCLTAALIIIISLLLIAMKKTRQNMTVAMYFLFGIFTLLATNFSLLCSPAVQQCDGNAIFSRTFVHTTFGLLAGICLFMAIVLEAQNRNRFRSFLVLTSIAWVILGLCSVLISFLVAVPEYQATLQRLYLLGASLYIYLLPTFLLSPVEKA